MGGQLPLGGMQGCAGPGCSRSQRSVAMADTRLKDQFCGVASEKQDFLRRGIVPGDGCC